MNSLSAPPDKTTVFQTGGEMITGAARRPCEGERFKSRFNFYKKVMMLFKSYPGAIKGALELPRSCQHVNNLT